MHVSKTSLPDSILPTIPQLRKQCRVYGDGEDDVLTAYRDAAIETVEGATGYGVGSSRWEVGCDLHRAAAVTLPRYPFDASRSWTIKVDGVDVDHDLDYGDTTLPEVRFDRQQTGYFKATFAAGKADPRALQAVRMLVGHMHESREAVAPIVLSEVPMGLRFLLDQLRPGGLI